MNIFIYFVNFFLNIISWFRSNFYLKNMKPMSIQSDLDHIDHHKDKLYLHEGNFAVNVNKRIDYFGIDDVFPDDIYPYDVRFDTYTNEPVTTNRLELLPDERVDYATFHRILQCPVSQNYDGLRGSMSLLKLLPPTKRTVLLMAVFLETDCFHPENDAWNKCHLILDEILNYQQQSSTNRLGWHKLYRIINGSIYYDWPWNIDQKIPPQSQNSKFSNQVYLVLSKLKDIKDSVFFIGEELPRFPSYIPFPVFTRASSSHHSDIVYPWDESFDYQDTVANKQYLFKDVAEETFEQWNSRESKAGWSGSMCQSRRVVVDVATKYPDLFYVTWGGAPGAWPWNPLSTEKYSEVLNYESGKAIRPENVSQMGYNAHLVPLFHKNSKLKQEHVSLKLKYLIVTQVDFSTTGRLCRFLAHSGSVILLQTKEFEYHFSWRLKPWVHYVPISYNTADIAEKVQWLNSNPTLAYKIARNAYNFGQSHLRIEDFYCYWATLLKELGELYENSDALEPFNPRPVRN